MSKDLPAKYYHEKKDYKKKELVEDIKIFIEKENKKSSNMIVNVTKIC